MHIVCTKENLQKGLSIVLRCVDQNANLPILSTILIKAHEGLITLSATNLEIGVSCCIRGMVKKEGVFAAPAKIITDYVANLPTNKIELTLKEDLLKLTSGDFEAEIKGLEADEFPLIPDVEEEVFCLVKGSVLKKALASVVFAAALDDSRPEISGVYFGFVSDGSSTCAATDGYRLAEKVLDNLNCKSEQKIIVPLKTAQEIARILSGEESEEAEIFLSKSQIKLILKNENDLQDKIEFFSKLTEGNYPEYQEIIPQDFQTRTLVNKSDFEHALKTTSLFSKKETSEVKLRVDVENESIEFSSESAGVGRNKSIVKGKIEGEDVAISFNYQYLLDGLSILKTDEIEVLFSSKDGPTVLKGVDDKQYKYIVMPLEIA